MLFHRVEYNAKMAIVKTDVLGYTVISKTHVFFQHPHLTHPDSTDEIARLNITTACQRAAKGTG